MADPTTDPGAANGLLGYLAAIIGGLGSAFVGFRMMKKDASNSAVTEASNDANIEAITTYKDLVSSLRTEKAAMEERFIAQLHAAQARADGYQAERNEAWKGLYAATGKLEAMADQIMNLNQEITLLRAEVAQLRGRQQGVTS